MTKRALILLTISVIFLGIFIAKYAHNFRGDFSVVSGSVPQEKGFVLPFGWVERHNPCLAIDEVFTTRGYPFVHQRGYACGAHYQNQTAVLINTSISFAAAALLVFGGYGAISAQRRYKQALKDYYQKPRS